MNPREHLLRRLRKTARTRYWNVVDKATYECPVCGDDSGPFDVHHRDGDPFNNALINLIGVCYTCHRREHNRRDRMEQINDWKESAPIQS